MVLRTIVGFFLIVGGFVGAITPPIESTILGCILWMWDDVTTYYESIMEEIRRK